MQKKWFIVHASLSATTKNKLVQNGTGSGETNRDSLVLSRVGLSELVLAMGWQWKLQMHWDI
jgi:hypothetical protein